MNNSLYLYHVTFCKNVNSIMKNGILIDPPDRNWEGAHAALPNRLYLCFQPYFAGGNVVEDGVVFLVDDLNLDHIVMDEDTIYPYWDFHWSSVKKENMKKDETEEDWFIRIIDEMGLCGGIASLLMNGTCAYKSDISPQSIKQKKSIKKYTAHRVDQTWATALHSEKSVIEKNMVLSGLWKRGTIEFPDGLDKKIIDILLYSETPIVDLIYLESSRKKSLAA